MEQELDRWYKKLWETKGARFIAANRLELHDKWSTVTVSLVSVYIISLNLLVLYPESNRWQVLDDLNITSSTVCLSVLILTVSLIISSRNYKLRADKYHECGRRITSIYDKVCLWKNTNYTPRAYEMERIQSSYVDLLDKYDNHRRIDFLMFQANNLNSYKLNKCSYLFWFKVKSIYYAQTVGLYLLVILIPLLAILIYL